MRSLLLAMLTLATAPALAQDNLQLFSTDINVRTGLTFKVADNVVQKMLPAGWELNSPTAGPGKGSNLGITLIDYVMVQDPEGKSLPLRNIIVLNIPAKRFETSESVTMVFGGFIAQSGVPGAYGVYGPANITVDRSSHTGSDGKSMVNETWHANADDGTVLDLQIEFERGVPTRSKVEAKVHSAAKPTFYRIYRFEQTPDVVRSTVTNIDRVSKFSFKASGPKLGQIFDGTEQLISITSIPSYSRSIFLPAM